MKVLEQLKNTGIELFDTSEVNLVTIFQQLTKEFNVSFGEKKVLVPRINSYEEKITLSGTYALGKFPYHTDAAHLFIPPRIISLRYLGDTESKTGTLLIDSEDIARDPDSGFYTNLTYNVKGGPTKFYATIFDGSIIPKRKIIRYNSVIMKRAVARNLVSFDEFLSKFAPKRISWRKGMLVLIDNWRIMHAREEVINEEIKTRALERIFFHQKN